MRRNQSKQTRILIVGLGIVALLAAWVMWATFARRSSATASTVSTTSASEAHDDVHDGSSPAAPDPQRDARASAGSVLAAGNVAVSSAGPEEMIEVVVVDFVNKKPVAKAELVYWGYSETEERDVDTWKWLTCGEFDAHLQQNVETTVADSDGKARVRKPKSGAIVTARSGELWGYGEFQHDADVPWRIELARDALLRARVVDSSDVPVGGARVALRFRSGDWFWDTVMVETGVSDGLAILPHAGYLLRNNDGGQQSTSIALGAVLDKSVEVVLDRAQLPHEPVKLVVPSTGACEVVVLGPDGAVCADELDVSLRQCMPDEMEPGSPPNTDRSALLVRGVRGGRARFPHVTPGLELIAMVSRPGSDSSHTARGPGPVAAGRSATVTVHMGQTLAIIQGRALDAHGKPLVKPRLRAWVEGEKEDPTGSDHAWSLEADDQGRFHVDVRPRTLEDGASVIVLAEFDERGVESTSASRPLPAHLPAGVHDLGDFTLTPTPVLAAGRVVDADNAPVRNATVQLSIKHRYGDDEDNFWWQMLWNQRAVSDAGGRFVVRGRVKADTLALAAEKEGLKAETVLVAPGAAEVVLRMLATGEIAGRVLLDPSLPNTAVKLNAERADTDRSTDVDANRWSPATLAEDGSFVLRGLRAGTYAVKLKDSTSWNDLQSFEGVLVVAGVTTRDPRLNPLDLRTSLMAIKLTIVDPDGQPVPHGSLQVTRRAASGDPQMSYARFENGKGTVTHDGHDVDILIASPGFCAMRIEHVHDDRQVTLRRAPRVRLVLAGAQRPPEKPFWLGVELTPVDGAVNYSSWSDEEVYFDARGQLSTFAPGVGRMKVGFSVTFQPNENSWSQTSFESEGETIIDVRDMGTEQVFEIACDAKQLATTIEGLRKENH